MQTGLLPLYRSGKQQLRGQQTAEDKWNTWLGTPHLGLLELCVITLSFLLHINLNEFFLKDFHQEKK